MMSLRQVQSDIKKVGYRGYWVTTKRVSEIQNPQIGVKQKTWNELSLEPGACIY